jgi:uncharacterized protein (TIRG00374 family)
VLKLVFLALGLIFLVAIIWQVGLLSIVNTMTLLGPSALGVILLPMVLVYGLEALGWRLTLGSYAGYVGFGRLFAIRMAGETINVTTPSAYIGGEPMKAYLLKRFGVPMVDGLASVVTAKTTMTIAQVLFIIVGVGLAFWILGTSEYYLVASVMSLGLLSFGVALFVFVQRYGLGMGVYRIVQMCRIPFPSLQTRKSQLIEMDATIRNFYAERRRTFYLALGTFFLAWMTETLEVYAILYYIGVPVDVVTSISIAALAVFIKSGTFFIPGSLGAQEGGYLLLLLTYGYTDVTGMTFALVRRLREILWILVGLMCLVLLKGRKSMRGPDFSNA